LHSELEQHIVTWILSTHLQGDREAKIRMIGVFYSTSSSALALLDA